MTAPATARRLWALAEPFHALSYFAAESRTAGETAGLTGFWASYFAFRAAPLGAVGAGTVTATFFNFAPEFVARWVPSVWDAVAPPDALAARLAGIDAAVRRVLGEEWIRSPDAAGAADLATRVATAVEPSGRPLAAANAGLTIASEPHLALWQTLTTLREYRGDGHNTALLHREITGVMPHVLAAAAGRSTREWLTRARGWADDRWDAAAEALAARGWLADGELTAAGRATVAAIEEETDRLAAGPWQALGDTNCERLAALLTPVRAAVVAAGDWPANNPIGAP
jgi:hypothetical protein